VALWSRGIDFERFSPAFRDADLRRAIGAADAPLLLFVGRLVREKDLADLIAVDGMLRQRRHRFVLALVGDGPMRAELKTAMPEAHFAGHLTGPALSRWFASADLFVFPSTTETFGNVVQEAAASGVPAVVAGRGGSADLVEDGATGLIARPNDAEDFARHVEALLQDPARRSAMGRRAREAAAARDWEAVNGRLIESYARLLGATRPEAR
jgi:phosphatidylinositol alpha 1,6-mannosyltransferase